MNNKGNRERKKIASDEVSRVLAIETTIFIGLMSIGALGLMYSFVRLLLFFLEGIRADGPPF